MATDHSVIADNPRVEAVNPRVIADNPRAMAINPRVMAGLGPATHDFVSSSAVGHGWPHQAQP
jgi:hypothetical protein